MLYMNYKYHRKSRQIETIFYIKVDEGMKNVQNTTKTH